VILGSPPDPSGGVVIRPPGSGTPTGQVFNTGGAGTFDGNSFLFGSEDGTISGWQNALGTTAERLNFANPANVYKGTTLATTGGHSYLLSANFRAGTIDVLKGEAGTPELAGNFTDPGTPANFAPFNIQLLESRIYVTYALQDATKQDDVAGAGNGFVDVYDGSGALLRRFASRGHLNAPWGIAQAPASFGPFDNAILIGNFGDGHINAYNPTNGAFEGQLQEPGGPIEIEGLWGLAFGNGATAGSANTLYFAAGPNDELDGLFGMITPTS